MGSIVTRKNGRRVIQWVDGSGKQRQETLKAKGVEGMPLSPRAADQLARRRLAELEEKARRQRHGLEPLPSAALKMTFGELMDWWWEQKGKTLRSNAPRYLIRKHLRPTLGPLPLREVTAARIQRLLADKSKELAPKSLNDLRAFIFNFYEVARKPGGPWEGRPNPVADVDRFKVTPKPRKVLAVDEFELVLAEVPRRWEGPVATGLYAGLREGEIFGLLKEDVDLRQGHVTFHGTRHSFATAVVRSAGTAVAQKALRHSDVRLTIHTYGHLDDRDVREGLEKAFPPLRAEAADCKSLQTAPEPGSEGVPFARGTADGSSQQPVAPVESGSPEIRTDARTAPSAASARTRCSSAA